MSRAEDKPLVWMHGVVRSPPFSRAARVETGTLLRRLQRGESLSLPHSRPLPALGARCHELRIDDREAAWRIVYRADGDAIIIVAVFAKKTRTLPDRELRECRRRLRLYDDAAGGR